MKVITGNRVPIKMWADEIDSLALGQVIDLASLPFTFSHVAIMPDVHAGLGMPIGGVLATKGVVVPNAVGVDIGCSMCALKTSLTVDDINREQLYEIVNIIRRKIPVGFGHQNDLQDERFIPHDVDMDKLPYVKSLIVSARQQVGTLGGGNHFIEIQKSDDGDIWVMIHSGSRNIGKKVAEHYGSIAKRFNEMWYSQTMSGLEFLPIECKEAKDYWNEMNYCVAFALCNRRLIMERVCEAIEEVFANVTFDPMINIAHNYAAWENHFGTDVIVHRKGATRARLGERGIIPGSQGTKSYIVEGLGNADSFMSCSHGAGRVMGRRDACRYLDLQSEIERMNAKGIIHSISCQKDLDEAPSAYKDIDMVIANQSDLVRTVVTLWPIAVIKGE